MVMVNGVGLHGLERVLNKGKEQGKMVLTSGGRWGENERGSYFFIFSGREGLFIDFLLASLTNSHHICVQYNHLFICKKICYF
jgi:hypothetical protein